MSHNTIAFIGTGNMSYAIIGGLIKSGFNPKNIIATNRNTEKLEKVANDFAIHTTQDNLKAIAEADYVVLSVKPQMMEALCQTIVESGIDYQDKVFISVAAGIKVERLQQMLAHPVKMIRCMPNTPSLLGKGVSGLYSNNTSQQEQLFASDVFKAVGLVTWLEKESQINDIIAVTGSSPAYLFLFLEALEQKALTLGFDQTQARQLVEQVAEGSAAMVAQSPNLSISELRANVTSKGGTTAAAIAHFEQKNLTQTVADAMDACIDRAQQMEREF